MKHSYLFLSYNAIDGDFQLVKIAILESRKLAFITFLNAFTFSFHIITFYSNNNYDAFFRRLANFFLFSTCRANPSDLSQAAEDVVVDGPQQNEKLKLIAFYFIQILLNECSSIKKHNLIALYS